MGDILMTYKQEVIKAMKMLSRHNRVVFLGQLINYWGCTYGTLVEIPKRKKIELPLAEELQMGVSIGLALEGMIPVTIYPRMDFLILAMNQLVNHLDKIEQMSDGEFKPKVIVRALVGSKIPLDCGVQHSQDHTELFRDCLTNIDIFKLTDKREIMPAYKKALHSDKSSLIIEVRDLYDT